MSSSRDSPFSFSPDVRSYLGEPRNFNGAVRYHHPTLFDGSVDSITRNFRDGILVRNGVRIPAGTPLAVFQGHIFEGSVTRSDFAIAMPPFRVHGVELHLSIDGAAAAARYPSPNNAAIFRHFCDDETVEGRWWSDPASSIPCLIAYAARELCDEDELFWCFDTATAAGPYTIDHAEARTRLRNGLGAQRCPCCQPLDCPWGRYIRTTQADVSDAA
jgi:hypothetical protein